jgi:hypothetical protein
LKNADASLSRNDTLKSFASGIPSTGSKTVNGNKSQC